MVRRIRMKCNGSREALTCFPVVEEIPPRPRESSHPAPRDASHLPHCSARSGRMMQTKDVRASAQPPLAEAKRGAWRESARTFRIPPIPLLPTAHAAARAAARPRAIRIVRRHPARRAFLAACLELLPRNGVAKHVAQRGCVLEEEPELVKREHAGAVCVVRRRVRHSDELADNGAPLLLLVLIGGKCRCVRDGHCLVVNCVQRRTDAARWWRAPHVERACHPNNWRRVVVQLQLLLGGRKRFGREM